MSSFYPVATVDEVSEGDLLERMLDETPVLLVRVGTNIYAIEGVCSHAYARLVDGDLEEYWLSCPLHFARYDIRTGTPVDGPATIPLKVFSVRVDQNVIYVKKE